MIFLRSHIHLDRILDLKILMQRFLQNDMIFFDQFKVPTVKFGKCFAVSVRKHFNLLLT